MPLGVIILYVTMSRALVSAQPSVFTDTADAGWNETFYSFYRIDQYSVRTRTNTGVTSSFATISHAAEGSLVHRSWVTRFELLPSCHNRASASRRVPVAPQLDFSPVAVDSIFHSTALPHSLGALTDLKKSPTDLEPGYPASVNVLRAVALFSFFPRSGPREGGTTIILQGTGFRRSRQVVCSFNFITAHSLIVPATVLSTTKLMCTSPRCTSERAAVVAVSVDGNNFVRAKGLSTLADTFYFTSHVPTGKFTSENATGPFTGGTLITVSNPILTSSKENLPPPLGGFEPSVLSTCLFAHRQHPSPSNNTFKLSDHGLSYNVTTSVKWLGYNRVQCVSPPWPVSTSGSTVLVTVHISNNGQDYSQAGVNFTYYDVIPVVSHIYTKQNAGAFEARGPWTGNTKVFIVGRGFQPSEYLIARFVSYEQVNGDLKVNHEHREGKCTFHDSGTVYCITPAWYPNLSSTTGKLKPCFETSVDISNDNGTRWSLSTTAKFVYCPVYVSTYGSNTWGDGTPRMPYRDLSRAIQAALTEPMSITSTRSRTKEHHGFSFGSNSYNKYLNSDQIVLMEGIYNDDSGLLGCERNLNLAMHGRVLEVIAQFPGRTFIDCSNRGIEVLRLSDVDDEHGHGAEQHGAIYFKDVGIVRCSGHIRWESHDHHRFLALTSTETREPDVQHTHAGYTIGLFCTAAKISAQIRFVALADNENLYSGSTIKIWFVINFVHVCRKIGLWASLNNFRSFHGSYSSEYLVTDLEPKPTKAGMIFSASRGFIE